MKADDKTAVSDTTTTPHDPPAAPAVVVNGAGVVASVDWNVESIVLIPLFYCKYET